MKLTTESLARATGRRPWITVGVWVLIIAAAVFVTSRFLGDALTTDISFTNEPEAVRAAEVMEDRFGKEGVTEIFLLSSEGSTVQDPAFESSVRELQATAADLGGDDIESAVTYYDTKDPSMISQDGRTTLMPVVFKDSGDLSDKLPTVEKILDAGNETTGMSAQSFGAITLDEDFNAIAEEDLARGESIGIIVALIVLVAVFGAVVAGVVPIAMGVASITVALGIVALVGQAFDFSFFVTNMISMMGLAVGIDYSLFIVSRYREERSRGREKLDAIRASGATASRAVFFSGMTVVLALVGMLILPTTIFRSLAAGAIFVVVVAVLASLTLLPALLGILGDRVNSLRVFRRKRVTGSEESHRFWDRITHGVMGRPVVSLIIGAGLLLAAAFSYLDINTGFSGVSTLPDDTPSKQAFVILDEEFSGGLNSPAEIVVEGDVSSTGVQGAISDLQALMEKDGLFGPSQVQVSKTEDVAVISAPIAADPSGRVATSTIERLRSDYVPDAFAG
ncbi:MAG: MMPL family transporter, partial [Actinobacteria bacterium]|nr:MMPL family transporter [Actinomycetota bacterium]